MQTIQTIKWVLTFRNVTQLEENSGLLVDSVNKRMFGELEKYQTLIENVIFATRQLNMSNAKFVEEMIIKYMGTFVLRDIFKFQKVDIGLKKCFNALEPTPAEKKHFLAKFLHRLLHLFTYIYLFFIVYG